MNFKELNLESVQIDEVTSVSVATVITIKDEEIESCKNDKAVQKLWRKFEKDYISSKTALEQADDVQINVDDENEPFRNKEHYCVVAPHELAQLDEKQIDLIDIGFRKHESDSDVLKLFDERLIKSIDKNVTKGVSIDDLEDTYNEILERIRNRVKEEKRKEEEAEDERRRKEEAERNEQLAREREEQAKAEMEKHEGLVDKPPRHNETDEVPEEEFEDEEVYEDDVVDDNPVANELQYLDDFLEKTIEKNVPKIEYSSFRTGRELLGITDDDDDFTKELKLLSAESIDVKNQREIDVLESERDEYIQTLKRQLNNKLFQRYTETGKVLNYTSDVSDFYHQYKEINDKYEESKKKARNQETNVRDKYEREYMQDRERIGEEAKARAMADFDRENRGLPEQQTIEYIDSVVAEINDTYEDEIETLINDVNNEYDKRYYRIVDDVIDEDKDAIEEIVLNYRNRIKNSMSNLNDEIEQIMTDCKERIQVLAKERYNSQKDLDNKNQRELDKLQIEYDNTQNVVKNLEDKIAELNKDKANREDELSKKLRDIQVELDEERSKRDSADKQLQIERENNKELSDSYKELYKEQLSSKKDALSVKDGQSTPYIINQSSEENDSNKGITGWVKSGLAALAILTLGGTGMYGVHETNKTKIEVQEMENSQQAELQQQSGNGQKDVSDLEVGDKAKIEVEENGKTKEVDSEVVKKDNGKVFAKYDGDMYEISEAK